MTGSDASAPVSLAFDDGLAIVTFDSPPLNLFDAALSDGLDEVIGLADHHAKRSA